MLHWRVESAFYNSLLKLTKNNFDLIEALSDKCEPVSEWPVTVALCRTELAPLGESGGAVKLEIGP